jgi:signal transduction histidine kinase
VAELALTLPFALGEGLTVDVRPDPMGAFIKADPAQVEQMLANLAAHALESGPDGGRMTVEIGRDDGEPARYVRITVSEEGAPLEEEEREHLFEPFFPMHGRKQGLGLPAVFGIVTQNGGRVGAWGRPGGGTVFRIHWPRWTGGL